MNNDKKKRTAADYIKNAENVGMNLLGRNYAATYYHLKVASPLPGEIIVPFNEDPEVARFLQNSKGQ